MHIAAVIGADIDGILVAPAEEFEQVQLDLAIARVKARLAPVQQWLRADRSRYALRLLQHSAGCGHT
jgi:hypothetical protein